MSTYVVATWFDDIGLVRNVKRNLWKHNYPRNKQKMDPTSVHFVISLRIISRKYYDKGSSKYFRTFIVLQFLLMLQHAGGKT